MEKVTERENWQGQSRVWRKGQWNPRWKEVGAALMANSILRLSSHLSFPYFELQIQFKSKRKQLVNKTTARNPPIIPRAEIDKTQIELVQRERERYPRDERRESESIHIDTSVWEGWVGNRCEIKIVFFVYTQNN